jgi:hypothetical protein
MRYLVLTPNLGLWYSEGSRFELRGYSDADYVGCKVDRKSTYETCQFLERSLVSLSSKKQNSFALSTAEVEYVATGSTARDADEEAMVISYGEGTRPKRTRVVTAEWCEVVEPGYSVLVSVVGQGTVEDRDQIIKVVASGTRVADTGGKTPRGCFTPESQGDAGTGTGQRVVDAPIRSPGRRGLAPRWCPSGISKTQRRILLKM